MNFPNVITLKQKVSPFNKKKRNIRIKYYYYYYYIITFHFVYFFSFVWFQKFKEAHFMGPF